MRIASKRGLGGLALLALLGLAGWQWRSDRAAAPGTLLPLAADQVNHITLQQPGQPLQVFNRHDGHWWRAGTPARRVDRDDRLEQVAAIAEAPVERWRPVQGMDLRALGLKPPQQVLTLNGRRLVYGVMTPFQSGRYVRVGDRIAVVPAQYTPRVAPARRIQVPATP